jgi:hypothetical protein
VPVLIESLRSNSLVALDRVPLPQDLGVENQAEQANLAGFVIFFHPVLQNLAERRKGHLGTPTVGRDGGATCGLPPREAAPENKITH